MHSFSVQMKNHSGHVQILFRVDLHLDLPTY